MGKRTSPRKSVSFGFALGVMFFSLKYQNGSCLRNVRVGMRDVSSHSVTWERAQLLPPGTASPTNPRSRLRSPGLDGAAGRGFACGADAT